MSLLKLPYTNLHELNLDWIIEHLNKEGAVLSVNDKHGIVTLTAEDIGRTPNNPQTVEQALTSQGSSIQAARNEIGVTPLPTTAQTITGAIAEHEQDITDINTEIGNTELPTIAQTLTGAISENAGEIANIEDNVIGSTPMGTTATTLTGAIAEHETDIGNINNDISTVNNNITSINNNIGNRPMGTIATTVTGAIAEIHTFEAVSFINGEYGNDTFFIRANNRVVILNGYFTFTNAPTGMVNIGSIATHKPISPVRCICALSDAAYNPPANFAYFTIGDNGNINVTAPAGNPYKVLYVSCAWVYQS